MQISNNYVMVEKIKEVSNTDEFRVVEVQDDFVYKGKVKLIPEQPVFIGNRQVVVGDIVWFAKYSPDTQELEIEGEKVKIVKTSDILLLQ